MNNMTMITNGMHNDPSASPLELMRLRRDRIRERRLRKGAVISGMTLNREVQDNLIELFPAHPDLAM